MTGTTHVWCNTVSENKTAQIVSNEFEQIESSEQNAR